ncbi:PREDICTED: AT-rich interactive domain-containing protein 3B [Elephantulus edwardii]|uniref:AT-rich interactive domain-containing protein 3B n=1 Tax=Elephantulus edwardii TaxID=28737 RepID=UPI0003F06860|nr:PREDICTED: AT-rich interactive domain-containing protein 3B [Elephantulus edwardii]
MEPLQQKQQQQQQQKQLNLASLQMDAREKQGQQMRDTQFLYAQKLVTQPTLLSATPGRPSASPALGSLARVPPATAAPRVFERGSMNSEPEEEEGDLEDEDGDDEDIEMVEQEEQAASKYFHVQKTAHKDLRAAPMSSLLPGPELPSHGPKTKEDHTKDTSKAPPAGSVPGQPSWNLDEQQKQNGALTWSDDADGSRGREISRDFAKLYELDDDPERKEFLDDLFIFMQKRGTPINRIPIMAKQILDLYMLYKLVTEKGGLVEIINKKIWREITKGLNLPTSITSAAFTLRTQYMKYLYAYECEKKALSSPAELQAAIDGNRREGRRPSYSSSLFGYPSTAASTAATGAPALLSPPKIRFPILGLGASSGSSASNPRIPPPATLRKGDGIPLTTVPVPNRLAVPVTLASQQASTRTATLEQLRERLEAGEPPEKKGSRLSEEEQRLVQQTFQRNFFNMARQLPMKIRINGREDRSEASAAALNLTTSSIGSINMSVDIDGTTYTGVLFAQKPVVHLIAGSAPQSIGSSASSSSSSHCSPSPTSSRGTPSAEPSTSWSL